MHWSTPEQIVSKCGPGKVSCATVATVRIPSSHIWAQKPRGFDDHERVCTLGHELLHALGADH